MDRSMMSDTQKPSAEARRAVQSVLTEIKVKPWHITETDLAVIVDAAFAPLRVERDGFVQALDPDTLNVVSAMVQLQSLRAENARLRKALDDAIELAEAGVGYTSEYFRTKHGMDTEMARITSERAALAAGGEEKK